MQIRVRYGEEEFPKAFAEGTTFGDVVRDYTVKAALGFGDNVKVTMQGVEMPLEAQVPAGALVTVETRANTKALVCV